MAAQNASVELNFPGTHRTDVMLEDQVVKVQDAQASLLEAMINAEEAESEEDSEMCRNQVETLHKRCSEMVLLLRVMIKVRSELGFSKIDLEEARKTGKNVKACQQRVTWLEGRLDKLMLSRRQRGRQRTRRSRHVGLGASDSAFMDVSRIRADSSEAAVQSFAERQASNVIPARDSSAALQQAASLLSELRRGRELHDSHVTTKTVSAASLGIIESDDNNGDDTTDGEGVDGDHSQVQSQCSSLFDDGDDEEEEDDDEDEEEESSEDSEATDSCEEETSDESDEDSEDADDNESNGSFCSRLSSNRDDSTMASEMSSVGSSVKGSVASLARRSGAASRLEPRGNRKPHLSLCSSRPTSTSKRSVTFLTEAPELRVSKGSVVSLVCGKTSSRSQSATSNKETSVSLPPIGQFHTSPTSETQSKADMLRELRKRQKGRPKKHAGSPDKPLKTPMQFGPVESMEDEFSWQTIGIAEPYSLVAAAYKRSPVGSFCTLPAKYRDAETEKLQTGKFNALLRRIEEVDVQMQYAGQFSADTKLPPLTLQGMRMSHSNKMALALSCGVDRGKQSPAPSQASQIKTEDRTVDSRASDAMSIVESFAESLMLDREIDEEVEESEMPDIKWTVARRNAPVYPQGGSSFLRSSDPVLPAFSLATAQVRNTGIKSALGKSSKHEVQRVPTPTLLDNQELVSVDKNWRANDRFGAKERRLKTILNGTGGWLNSQNPVERRSAAKELGELGLHDTGIVTALLEKVNDPDFIVCYQASRSLILLGEWHLPAGEVIAQFLEHGSEEAKLDLLEALLCAHQATRVLAHAEAATCLECSMESNLDVANVTAAGVRSAHCLALMHKERTNGKVVSFLQSVADTGKEEGDRVQALDTLYKDIKVPGHRLVGSYFAMLLAASVPKHRVLCVSRLGTIACSFPDQVRAYPKMETLLREKLWNDAYKQVSFGAACILKTLGWEVQACKDVQKQLESCEPTVRLKGVKSMAALRMKARHNIQVLIDLVRMDPSQDVQRSALKALVQLQVRNGQAIRLLQSKAKGSGPLQQ